jgi:hypothetical protein
MFYHTAATACEKTPHRYFDEGIRRRSLAFNYKVIYEQCDEAPTPARIHNTATKAFQLKNI